MKKCYKLRKLTDAEEHSCQRAVIPKMPLVNFQCMSKKLQRKHHEGSE